MKYYYEYNLDINLLINNILISIKNIPNKMNNDIIVSSILP